MSESELDPDESGRLDGTDLVEPAPFISLVFSDVDGALVHYHDHLEEFAEVVRDNGEIASIVYHESGEKCECKVLPSLTGSNGYISHKTLELVDKIQQQGVTFVIITSQNSAYYLTRRHLLPIADSEIWESGGRILHGGHQDRAWSAALRHATGFDGEKMQVEAPDARDEPLWQAFRELRLDGWKVDIKDFHTQFRVLTDKRSGDESLWNGAQAKLRMLGLSWAEGNRCRHVYPETSGRVNAARHVLRRAGVSPEAAAAIISSEAEGAPLSTVCGRTFLPHGRPVHDPNPANIAGLISPSKKGPLGTEEVLEMILGLSECTA